MRRALPTIVVLALGLLCPAAWAQERPSRSAVEAPEKVVAVELHLPPGSDAAGLPDRIAVRRGYPLSAREVRRSIERLFATGRFSDVVVRSFPAEGGVRVVFQLTPKRFIRSVEVLGARVLTPQEALGAARLGQGEEYYPELMDEAADRVAQLYRRRGYRNARISVELREVRTGLEVLLAIEEGAPTFVTGVSVGGNPGLPVPRVVEALGLGPGQILNLDRLEAGLERLKALYRNERFYRARVGDPELVERDGGLLIALPVTAGPRYDFEFRGNRSFPPRMLRAMVRYDGTELLDEGVMARMARRIATFYRYRGFNDVTVRPREVRSPNHARGKVVFDIVEGRPLFVERVSFVGNSVLRDELLERILADQVLAMAPVPEADVAAQDDPLELEGRRRGGRRYPAPNPEPTRIWVAEAYEDAARAMRDAYREQGYLRAKVTVDQVRIDVARQRANVKFAIEEGPQARIAHITYDGLPAAYDPSPSAQVREGQAFRASAVDDTARSLMRALGRKGYLFARVQGEGTLSPDGREARVAFAVEPGPRVRVGQVIVRGLKRTEEAVVRANLVVREGSVLDPESLFDSQRNLVLLGVFRTVAVKLIAPETIEPTKDVVVEVTERPRLSGELGGGYSLVDGPRLVGDLVYPNLWGAATSLSGRLKVNYVGASALVLTESGIDPEDVRGIDGLDFRGNVALAQQRIYELLPARVGARLDLIAERAHRPSYTFSRIAAVTGVDWAALSWLNMSLQYEIEQDGVSLTKSVEELLPELGRTDLERLRFPRGSFPMHSVRPTITLDFRDDFARPSKGFLFSGSAEVTNDLGATLTDANGDPVRDLPIHTLKVSGNLTGYIPLAPRTVIALSARGGKIFHLQEDSETIAPKRFFLGGANSMRGFREDAVVAEDRREALRQDVEACRMLALPSGCTPDATVLRQGREIPSEGGELYTLLKSELRFPAWGAFDMGVFLEAGNLWLDAANYDPLRLRYVAGAGVRYGTPIGPMALDVGFNLSPDVLLNEPAANLHFSIGLF